MQIDDTDRQLITLLQDNARLPVATLARRLGLARTTVQARLDRMESSGLIVGYVYWGTVLRQRAALVMLPS